MAFMGHFLQIVHVRAEEERRVSLSFELVYLHEHRSKLRQIAVLRILDIDPTPRIHSSTNSSSLRVDKIRRRNNRQWEGTLQMTIDLLKIRIFGRITIGYLIDSNTMVRELIKNLSKTLNDVSLHRSRTVRLS